MLSDLKKTVVIISDRTNPIRDGKRAAEFSAEKRKFLFAWAFAAAELSVIALSFAFGTPVREELKMISLLAGGLLGVTVSTSAIFFRNMLVMKKGEYARKLMDVSGRFQDDYQVARLKFAVSFPELPPPIEAGYVSAQRRFAREIWAMDFLKQRCSKHAYSYTVGALAGYNSYFLENCGIIKP